MGHPVQGNSQTNCVLWMHSLATQPETERNPKGTHKTTKESLPHDHKRNELNSY